MTCRKTRSKLQKGRETLLSSDFSREVLGFEMTAKNMSAVVEFCDLEDKSHNNVEI